VDENISQNLFFAFVSSIKEKNLRRATIRVRLKDTATGCRGCEKAHLQILRLCFSVTHSYLSKTALYLVHSCSFLQEISHSIKMICNYPAFFALGLVNLENNTAAFFQISSHCASTSPNAEQIFQASAHTLLTLLSSVSGG